MMHQGKRSNTACAHRHMLTITQILVHTTNSHTHVHTHSHTHTHEHTQTRRVCCLLTAIGKLPNGRAYPQHPTP